jgi:hypothetical protein
MSGKGQAVSLQNLHQDSAEVVIDRLVEAKPLIKPFGHIYRLPVAPMFDELGLRSRSKRRPSLLVLGKGCRLPSGERLIASSVLIARWSAVEVIASLTPATARRRC